MATGSVRAAAIVSIGDAFLRVGRSRRLAWSYALNSFFPIIRQGPYSGGPPAGMNSISMCCALRRAALGAIVSLILCELTARAVRVFVYPAFTRLTARRREQLIVRELDGLKRRVVARPCIYPLPCARCDLHGSFYAASVHLRSLSHKLESLQASYPQMSVRRLLCPVVKCGFSRSSALLASFGGDLSSSLGGEFFGAGLAAHAGEFGDRERFLLHACNIPRGPHASR